MHSQNVQTLDDKRYQQLVLFVPTFAVSKYLLHATFIGLTSISGVNGDIQLTLEISTKTTRERKIPLS